MQADVAMRTAAAPRVRSPGVWIGWAFGIAFAAQEVDAVPIDAWDQQLDLIVTDRSII